MLRSPSASTALASGSRPSPEASRNHPASRRLFVVWGPAPHPGRAGGWPLHSPTRSPSSGPSPTLCATFTLQAKCGSWARLPGRSSLGPLAPPPPRRADLSKVKERGSRGGPRSWTVSPQRPCSLIPQPRMRVARKLCLERGDPEMGVGVQGHPHQLQGAGPFPLLCSPPSPPPSLPSFPSISDPFLLSSAEHFLPTCSQAVPCLMSSTDPCVPGIWSSERVVLRGQSVGPGVSVSVTCLRAGDLWVFPHLVLWS